MKAVASVKTKPGKDAKGGKQTKKQLLRGKNAQKKKKEHLRFGVDCTNIAEDNIMDVADFVSIAESLSWGYWKGNECVPEYLNSTLIIPTGSSICWS